MFLVRGITFVFLFTVNFKAGISTDNDHALDEIIGSIFKITEFFEKDSKELNLDGLFGIHSSQEQLAVLLENISKKCSPWSVSHLKGKINALNSIQNRLEQVYKTSINRIKNNYRAYFKLVGFVFGKDLWKFLGPLQYVDTALLYPKEKLNPEELNETASDICLSQLDQGTCQLSRSCLKFASDLYHENYYITHQYLLLLIGKLHGCEKQFDKTVKTFGKHLSTARLITTFCSNILTESRQFAEDNFPEALKDLFMEQLGLCGISGFHEFFQPEWIKEIISWQDPSGCFKYTPFRVRREERLMSGNCGAHMTTVALLALQQATRFLLEPQLKRSCEYWNK